MSNSTKESEALKRLVDSYIEQKRSGELIEDSDIKQYIFEQAVQLFYGPSIWSQIRKWSEPRECPTCQRKITFCNSEECK